MASSRFSSPSILASAISAIHFVKVDVIKTEHLYTFDRERGYSLGQGE